MTGTTTLQAAEAPGLARVTLSQPGKLNAVDLAMWRSLRAIFERLQAMPQSEAPRAVVVCGEGGNFAAGGDILEFAQFRFDEERLRHFHEDIVAPTLHAVLACDIPLVAQIEGVCLGAGFEIAACCDIRVCGQGSRFGAPIAKLGFPMAPDELEVLARIAEPPVLREMLLEARLLDAQAALRHGLVHTVVPDAQVAAEALQRATRIASLAPQAARINKISLRQLIAGGPTFAERHAHFAYADSADHREGVMAFIEKRAPVFDKP